MNFLKIFPPFKLQLSCWRYLISAKNETPPPTFKRKTNISFFFFLFWKQPRQKTGLFLCFFILGNFKNGLWFKGRTARMISAALPGLKLFYFTTSALSSPLSSVSMRITSPGFILPSRIIRAARVVTFFWRYLLRGLAP